MPGTASPVTSGLWSAGSEPHLTKQGGAADLGQLAQLRNLRALKVPGSYQLSTRGLKGLSMLTGLTCLDLAGVLISAPRGLASILDTFPALACLGLQGCR